jgi:hypothetical protein
MSHYFLFTVHNPEGMFIEADFPPTCTYWCYQEELAPTTGIHHLQGYMEYNKQYRINAVKTMLVCQFGWPNTVHLEARRGTAEQNRAYCSKPDTAIADSFIEWGTLSISKQGKRTEIHDAMLAVQEGCSKRELMENHPMIVAKFPKFINTYYQTIAQERIPAKLFTPRGWQITESLLLLEPPSSRKIRWVWDPIGNVGKTYFAKGFKYDGTKTILRLTAGKHADINYLIAQSDVNNLGAIFFDFPRKVEEHVPYTVMESIKDQTITSTKYECIQIQLPQVHVVCFANFPPDREALSADRWDVCEIRNLAY